MQIEVYQLPEGDPDAGKWRWKITNSAGAETISSAVFADKGAAERALTRRMEGRQNSFKAPG